MVKIKKEIEINEDDFVALQIIAIKRKTNLKNCIEELLHQFVTMDTNPETEKRIDLYDLKKEDKR